MKLCVDAIRNSLEGPIPTTLATCSLDGVPNVTYVSQVEYVDNDHVAMSFQFFNKTRENILAHPYATGYITDSQTGASYRLSLQYVRTETAGRLFEYMKAKLAGIASHTGMEGVFRLLGSDVYRVLAIELVPTKQLAPAPSRRNPLRALRIASERVAGCCELAALLDETLLALADEFDITHSMILMLDEEGTHLYTVVSRGYAASGVGSEIPLNHGVIGVAAAQRTPIRIAYMTSEYAYGRAIRESAVQAGLSGVGAEIPFPGMAAPHSQLAVPILSGERLFGVLYVESTEEKSFGYDEEDALVALANQIGLGMRALQNAEALEESPRATSRDDGVNGGAPVPIRHYTENNSIFVGDDYLIKGVAGAIFWKLLREFTAHGRTEFNNRELRLDPDIRLPDIDDNLDARLILLARRLNERCDFLAIEKTGRGRFRLNVKRQLELLGNAA